jgi:hypothetical protein
MPEEKSPRLSQSSPPRAPMTEIELLITLDRMRRSIDSIDSRLAAAEANDKRFEKMETHFNVAKWFAGIALVAAVGSLVASLGARMSWRLDTSPPTPPSLQGR